MSLTTGTRLGPFEVLAPLGAGGMGEVYRARDTRLSREVAIKVLPSELSSDAARLKRFEKEALSASSLNHPNIVTIYEVGREGATEYIAMELVDGKTLRALIGSEPLPIKKLLAISAQIADGLAKAHASGIVHRDLKPENVMVTGDGRVKVLDFGLAKLARPEVDSDSGLTQTPTVSADTGAGVVMGTVGYMSPEQACGRPADFRSDQFSLGAIVYEMATGRRAFQRQTAPEALAAIIREEPEPIAALNSKAPVPLRWIVERCLAKDPKERYASTEDLARDLATIRERMSEATLPSGLVAASPMRRRALPLVAGSLLIAAAAFVFVARRPQTVSVARYRQLTFRRGGIWTARFAPDGQTVVYAARWEGTDPSDLTPHPAEIFSTSIGGPESRALGLPRANVLSVSSSGQLAILIGKFPRLGTLAQVPLGGGAPRELLADVNSADWSPEGNLAVVHTVGGKRRLELPIGKVLYETAGGLGQPRFSPRGDLVLFRTEKGLHVTGLDGKSRVLLPPTIGEFAWAPSGEEILFAQVNTTATEIRAVDMHGKVRHLGSLPGDWALHDVSRNGALLMERVSTSCGMIGLAPGDARPRKLDWLDQSTPAGISADGKTLLFTDRGAVGESAVYLRSMNGSVPVRLGEGTALALSPDGKWALCEHGALLLLPTAAGETIRLDTGGIERLPHLGACWARDGKRIFFCGHEPNRRNRVFALEVGGGAPRPVTPEGTVWAQDQTMGTLPAGAISPDEGWVIAEDRSLVSLKGDGKRRSSRLETGDVPLSWSADGESVFVVGGAESDFSRWTVQKVGLDTGKRERTMQVVPPEPIGSGQILALLMSDGGNAWVYSYERGFSDLFLVEGLR